MNRDQRRQRQRTVTDEPFVLDPALEGRPLAGMGRRSLAIILDLLVVVLVGTPLLLAATLGALYVQTPALATTVVDTVVGDGSGERFDRGVAELLSLVARRQPGAVPLRFAAPLAEGDLDTVAAMLEEDSLQIFHDLDDSAPTYYDAASDTLHVHRDVVFGPLAPWVGLAAIALVYFTLATWIGGGRTPGKWLLGLRAVRLDGRAMGLADAFGRAGGYAASLSTLGLGFLQALRDPNRQALHDRIARTVVIRDSRR